MRRDRDRMPEGIIHTGGAWLSSARVVRCSVKSGNERNPRDMLPAEDGTHIRLPVRNRRKAGMTSNHHAPYGLGYTRTTMAATEGSDSARRSESQKAVPVRIGVCNPTP